MEVRGRGPRGEAPWKKLSKEVGGSQGAAGAERCSAEVSGSSRRGV